MPFDEVSMSVDRNKVREAVAKCLVRARKEAVRDSAIVVNSRAVELLSLMAQHDTSLYDLIMENALQKRCQALVDERITDERALQPESKSTPSAVSLSEKNYDPCQRPDRLVAAVRSNWSFSFPLARGLPIGDATPEQVRLYARAQVQRGRTEVVRGLWCYRVAEACTTEGISVRKQLSEDKLRELGDAVSAEDLDLPSELLPS